MLIYWHCVAVELVNKPHSISVFHGRNRDLICVEINCIPTGKQTNKLNVAVTNDVTIFLIYEYQESSPNNKFNKN